VWTKERREEADVVDDQDNGLWELYLGPNPVVYDDATDRINPLSPFVLDNGLCHWQRQTTRSPGVRREEATCTRR
jgi:hypothetical protein